MANFGIINAQVGYDDWDCDSIDRSTVTEHSIDHSLTSIEALSRAFEETRTAAKVPVASKVEHDQLAAKVAALKIRIDAKKVEDTTLLRKEINTALAAQQRKLRLYDDDCLGEFNQACESSLGRVLEEGKRYIDTAVRDLHQRSVVPISAIQLRPSTQPLELASSEPKPRPSTQPLDLASPELRQLLISTLQQAINHEFEAEFQQIDSLLGVRMSGSARVAEKRQGCGLMGLLKRASFAIEQLQSERQTTIDDVDAVRRSATEEVSKEMKKALDRIQLESARCNAKAREGWESFMEEERCKRFDQIYRDAGPIVDGITDAAWKQLSGMELTVQDLIREGKNAQLEVAKCKTDQTALVTTLTGLRQSALECFKAEHETSVKLKKEAHEATAALKAAQTRFTAGLDARQQELEAHAITIREKATTEILQARCAAFDAIALHSNKALPASAPLPTSSGLLSTSTDITIEAKEEVERLAAWVMDGLTALGNDTVSLAKVHEERFQLLQQTMEAMEGFMLKHDEVNKAKRQIEVGLELIQLARQEALFAITATLDQAKLTTVAVAPVSTLIASTPQNDEWKQPAFEGLANESRNTFEVPHYELKSVSEVLPTTSAKAAVIGGETASEVKMDAELRIPRKGGIADDPPRPAQCGERKSASSLKSISSTGSPFLDMFRKASDTLAADCPVAHREEAQADKLATRSSSGPGSTVPLLPVAPSARRDASMLDSSVALPMGSAVRSYSPHPSVESRMSDDSFSIESLTSLPSDLSDCSSDSPPTHGPRKELNAHGMRPWPKEYPMYWESADPAGIGKSGEKAKGDKAAE